MSYTKTTWVNNTTPINETNLNKIEQGIYDNSLITEAIADKLNPTDTETYKTAELTEGQITDVIGVNDIVIKGDTEQDGTPTPSAPVDVNVVSGSNVINTSSKNLLDKDGEISQGATNDAANTTRLSIRVKHKLKANTTYTVITNLNTSNFYWAFVLGTKVSPWSNEEQLYDSTWKNTNYWSYTTSQECYINIPIKNSSNTNININDVKDYWFMLYEGAYDSSISYQPHQGKELPLDLGNVELCKIGNYQDYFYKSGSKWYLHKEVEKKVLNGSEEWTLRSGSRFDVDIPSANGDFISTGLSNQYKFIANWDTHLTTNHSFIVRNGTWGVNKCRISLINTDYEDVTQFKADLATNNLIVYYQKISQLGGVTNTEITNTTLISQLEAIYNAPLYEQTNITQANNDLPMVLDITACKDNINGIKAFIRK